ncbi:hypothetical protein ABZU53_14600 [Micromonospora sp. NPDC005194]|uniref:hypothetical protein n=1 Tax=Micromonospora sp. NPDC005194 TaxID=3156870 RepID=UPI0033A4FEA3
MDRWLGIGGFITGVVGLVLTVYYARKAEELNLMRKRLEWPDLQAAANDLGRRIKTEFPPTAIIAPGVAADRIRAASVAVTRVACRNHKSPEYYWWLANSDDFFFPWGKAR